jgi:DNA repair exonuclease SbcCD ATPase subunit
MQKQEIDEKN